MTSSSHELKQLNPVEYEERRLSDEDSPDASAFLGGQARRTRAGFAANDTDSRTPALIKASDGRDGKVHINAKRWPSSPQACKQRVRILDWPLAKGLLLSLLPIIFLSILFIYPTHRVILNP